MPKVKDSKGQIYLITNPLKITRLNQKQIIEYSQKDPLVKKFTHDHTRFKDLSSINRWYQKGKRVYFLIRPRNKLVGLIWFGKSKLNRSDLKAPNFTFAIRIYQPARGLGLSEKFFTVAYKDFLKKVGSENLKYKGLWLKTNRKNRVALHLYQKLRFKVLRKTNEELFMVLRE